MEGSFRNSILELHVSSLSYDFYDCGCMTIQKTFSFISQFHSQAQSQSMDCRIESNCNTSPAYRIACTRESIEQTRKLSPYYRAIVQLQPNRIVLQLDGRAWISD